MRPRSVLSTAALLLVAVTGCVSSTDSLGEVPEVEVTDYGTRWREEKFVAEAEYTIRNPYSDPVEFRVGFSFHHAILDGWSGTATCSRAW